MKRIFICVLSFLTCILAFAQTDKALANAQKTQGLYIFNDCEPISDYEVIERVKNVVSFWSADYEHIKGKLIKKALKDHPDAQGLILTMSNKTSDAAAVIKFKDNVSKEDQPKAKVIRENGLLVFSDCEPANEYEIIDRGKAGLTWSGQYSENKNKLLKKAIKKHGNRAEGIVINGGKSVVIRFK